MYGISVKKRSISQVSAASSGSPSSPPYKSRYPNIEQEVNEIMTDLSTRTGGLLPVSSQDSSKHSSEQAPAYFQQAMEQIRAWFKPVDSIATTLQHLLDAVNEAQTEAAEAKKQAFKARAEVTTLRHKLEQLEVKSTTLENKVKECERALIENENYSRRENLVFYGIQENHNEVPTEVIKDVFTKMGIEEVAGVRIQRCHRLNAQHITPRPMIVRFQWFQDRQNVWQKRRNLKGSKISVSENFHPQVEANRRKLFPIFKAAKHIPGITKAFLVKDRLVINSATYTVDTLHLLPDNLKPETTSKKENESTLVFFGKDSLFSNFHPTPFTIDGTTYNCVEQYFCYKKAVTFNDEESARLIMETSEPAKQKSLGRKIKNFHSAAWKNMMEQTMEEGIQAKFTQNHEFKDKLLKTRGKILGEASPRDNIWGIGLGLHSGEVLDSHAWKGSNLLGKLLMKVRDSC